MLAESFGCLVGIRSKYIFKSQLGAKKKEEWIGMLITISKPNKSNWFLEFHIVLLEI